MRSSPQDSGAKRKINLLNFATSFATKLDHLYTGRTANFGKLDGDFRKTRHGSWVYPRESSVTHVWSILENQLSRNWFYPRESIVTKVWFILENQLSQKAGLCQRVNCHESLVYPRESIVTNVWFILENQLSRKFGLSQRINCHESLVYPASKSLNLNNLTIACDFVCFSA